MHKLKHTAIALVLVASLCLGRPTPDVAARPLAATAPDLGVAGSYSVLAAEAVTNSGLTTMPGDLGISGGAAPIGFTGPPEGTVGPPGTIRSSGDATSAQGAAQTAVLAMESQGPGTVLGSDLSGATLTPGVYTVPGTSLLPGILTLDGPGVYIFLTDELTFSGSVNFINGADGCNVFWRDASSVTINAGAAFVGTVIALTSISLGTGATVEGRTFAQNGSVTLLANTFSNPVCARAERERDRSVGGLPNTGGAPIRNADFPWAMIVVGGMIAGALFLRGQALQRKDLSRK